MGSVHDSRGMGVAQPCCLKLAGLQVRAQHHKFIECSHYLNSNEVLD